MHLAADRWHGVFAIPCATFDDAGQFDARQFERQLAFCLDARVHGIAVPLLASEFYTLSDAERRAMVEVAVGTVAGAVPVLASVSGTSTAHAVEFARHAAGVGACGVIAMPPYIARLGPDDIVAYFSAVAAACDLPMMVQNAGPPQPVGFPLDTVLLARICRAVPAARYVKEERTPGPYFLSDDLAALAGQVDGVFGGRAGLYLLDELQRGGAGTMVAPEFADFLVAVYEAFRTGQVAEARRLHERLLPGIAKEVLLGPQFAKRVLRRRGVLTVTTVRSGPERWDDFEEAALNALWEALDADPADTGTTVPEVTH